MIDRPALAGSVAQFSIMRKPQRQSLGRPRRRCRATRLQRRGAALLELVLILPILLAISFGATDYGYFFYVKNTIQGAASAGGRAAVPVGATNSDVTTAVANMMSASGFTASTYTTSITDLNGNALDLSSAGSGVPVKVTVSCSWGTIGLHALPVSLGGIANTKTVTGVSVMMTE